MVQVPRFSAIDFDDSTITPFSGLSSVAGLASQLGLSTSILTHLPRQSGERPDLTTKATDLVLSMCAGGDFIEHTDVLRNRATRRLLGKRYAATTIGQALRGLSSDRAQLFDSVLGDMLGAAWSRLGAPVNPTIDIDSTICEVYGSDKEGAAFGYTKVRGYHPQLATLAGTNEVLSVKMRPGNENSGKDGADFAVAVVERVREAGATGVCSLRADSAFFSYPFVRRIVDAGATVSVGVPMYSKVKRAVQELTETAWLTRPGYSSKSRGHAWVTALPWRVVEASRPPARAKRKSGRRPKDGSGDPPHVDGTLVIRRVSHDNGATYEHFAFFTTAVLDPADSAQVITADKTHRRHAVVERSIRDLKAGAWVHHPSGQMGANTAWSLLGAIAHNLLVWAGMLARGSRKGPMVMTQTVRKWLVCVPGRILGHARQQRLSLPQRWPYQRAFLELACVVGISP